MRHIAFLLLMLGWALGAFAEGTAGRKTTTAATAELVLPTDDLIRDERNCAPEVVTPLAPIEAPVVIDAPTKSKPRVAKPAAPKPYKPTIFKAAKAPKHAKKSAWAWLALLPAGLLALLGVRRLKAAMGDLLRLGVILALVGLILLILGALVGFWAVVVLGAVGIIIGALTALVGYQQGDTL